MVKFSSQEIEGKNNWIKMLLAEPEKYTEAIDAIKKDIGYVPIEIKKKAWLREYYIMSKTLTK